MSYAAVSGRLAYPSDVPVFTYASLLIDASGEKASMVLQVPKTGTLGGFGVLLGTVTQAPVSGLRFSFQDPDASGDPDGAQDQYRDVASGITTAAWLEPSGNLTSNGTDGGSLRSVTKGDYLCLVVEFVSFSASDSLNVQRANASSSLNINGGLPYCGLYTGSWTKTAQPLVAALRYSDGTYVFCPAVPSWKTVPASTGSFNTSTVASDERGQKFTVPFGCKINGARLHFDPDAACDVVLYDSGGSVLASKSVTPINRNSASAAAQIVEFESAATVAAGAVVYLVLKPTTTSNVQLFAATLQSGLQAATPGGAGSCYVTRVDAGAWTEDATQTAVMQLLISDVEIPDVVAPRIRITGPRPTSRR